MRSLISLCFILLATTRAQAFGWHDRLEPLVTAASELDLSADQQTKMKAIQEQMQPRLEQLRVTAHEARQRFEAAMTDEATTAESLTKINEEMIAARAAMTRARFQRMLAIRSLLSQDQLKTFLEHHGKGHERRREK